MKPDKFLSGKTNIETGTWEMKSAFLALMSMCPGELIIDRSLECAAEYQPDMHIHINPERPEDRLFYELCRETHFSVHDHDSAEPRIDYDCLMFDAECVSYMVCREYGIKSVAPTKNSTIKNHYGLLSIDGQEVVLNRLLVDVNSICAVIDYELQRLERDRLKGRKDYGR